MSYQNTRREKIHTGCGCMSCNGRHFYDEHHMNKQEYIASRLGEVKREYVRDDNFKYLYTIESCLTPKEIGGFRERAQNKKYRRNTRKRTRRALHKTIRQNYKNKLRRVQLGLANECEIIIIGLGYTD